jgi:hypothetical protein
MYNDGIHRFNPGNYQGRNWLLESLSQTAPAAQAAEPKKEEQKAPPIQSGNELWSGGGGYEQSPSQSTSTSQGYNSNPGAMVSPGGYSFGFDSSKGMQGSMRGGLLGGIPGMLGGLAGGITLQSTAPVYNSVAPSLTEYGRAMAGNEALGGILGDNFSSAERSPAPTNQDIENSIYGGGVLGGGWGDASSIGGASVGSGYNGSGYNGFAKGGKVTKDRLFGLNPPGKDDGAAFLDAGEHVTKASASKYYGDQFMSAINKKQIPKSKAMGLLKGL